MSAFDSTANFRLLIVSRDQLLRSNESYLEHLKIKLAAKSYKSVANSIGATCTKMINGVDEGIVRVEAVWREKLANLRSRAEAIAAQIESLNNKDPMTFAFIEGILVTSMRSGDWILLDEINLAEPEMLECLASVLDGQQLILQVREKERDRKSGRSSDGYLSLKIEFEFDYCRNVATWNLSEPIHGSGFSRV